MRKITYQLSKKKQGIFLFFTALACLFFFWNCNFQVIKAAQDNVPPAISPVLSTEPTTAPTDAPTVAPTQMPTGEPTQVPTANPTQIPSVQPTDVPDRQPTNPAVVTPTATPTPVSYTLSFDSNGGSDAAPIQRPKGEIWGVLPVPTRPGYTFLYWYNSDTKAKYETNCTRIVKKDITVTAKWSLNTYNITYALNGGAFSSVSPTTSYKITSPQIPLPEPIRKKYLFKGWYTAPNFSGKQMSAIAPGSYGNVTFYAKWEKAAPASVSISSLKNTSNKLTVKLKKVSKAKGYEIKVSTDKNFKKCVSTYDLGTSTSYSFVNPAKKTYYVKARAYAYDSYGSKVYSSYGKTAKYKVTKTTKEYAATSTSAKFTSAKALSCESIRLKATIKKRVKSSDDYYYLVKLNPSNNKVEKSVKKLLKEKYLDVTLPINGQYSGNLLTKYAIAIKQKGKYVLISKPTYITNPEKSAVNTMKYVKPASKKGIQGATIEDLGSKNTLLNMDLKNLISTNGTGTPYVYNGKTYYFTDYYVGQVRHYNSKGINVSMVVLLSWDDNLTYLIHPSARVRGKNYYALNTEEKQARETLEAAFSYMGTVFGQKDCYVSNWILGNEVNAHKVWNYAGNLSLNTYANSYAQAFRMLYYGVKHGFQNARVFISLDNEWTKASNGFSGKSFLTAFSSAMKKENSKVDWNIAYHAYPAPLTAAAFWKNTGITTKDTTPYITPLNIEVLTKYVKKHYGSDTRIILSEQGFTSTAGDTTQAAALAYAYYKCEFNSMIDAFIIRSEYDADVEVRQGLSLGLIRTSPWGFKEAYNVYKYMDTPQSESYTKKYLSVIGAKKWSSIVPGYKASKFKSMPAN